MLIFLGIFAAALLGGMIYTFLSRKSTKAIKLAALIALVLSGISLAVCSIFIVFNAGKVSSEGLYPAPVPVEKAPVSSGNDILVIVIVLIILLAFFGFIFFLGLRDQKKKAEFSNSGARAGGGKKAAGSTAGANTVVENAGENSEIELDSLDF
jgi:heme/copper-type cytochrome/quinol oxidase subunit 2